MLNRYDVYTADEAFLTGTAPEVVGDPRRSDGRVIGAGKSGPITRDLRARFQALVRQSDDGPGRNPTLEWAAWMVWRVVERGRPPVERLGLPPSAAPTRRTGR